MTEGKYFRPWALDHLRIEMEANNSFYTEQQLEGMKQFHRALQVVKGMLEINTHAEAFLSSILNDYFINRKQPTPLQREKGKIPK